MDLETVAMTIIAYSGDARGQDFQAVYSCQLTKFVKKSINHELLKLISFY